MANGDADGRVCRCRKSIAQVFEEAKASGRAAFITFTTCGYKTTADTVDVLLALQRGGANLIEVRPHCHCMSEAVGSVQG